jgi:hypothetical protein
MFLDGAVQVLDELFLKGAIPPRLARFPHPFIPGPVVDADAVHEVGARLGKSEVGERIVAIWFGGQQLAVAAAPERRQELQGQEHVVLGRALGKQYRHAKGANSHVQNALGHGYSISISNMETDHQALVRIITKNKTRCRRCSTLANRSVSRACRREDDEAFLAMRL